MTTALDAWGPDINPVIAGLPSIALEVSVRAAAIAFCKGTHIWQGDLDRVSVVADDNDYDLSAPSGAGDAAIYLIENVKYKQDGLDDDQFIKLEPLSQRQADRYLYGNWNYTESTTPSGYYYDVTSGTLYLYPIPTEASASGLLVRVAYIPTQDATTVPTFLFNDHRMAIAQGALAVLHRQGMMPWFDLQTAAYEQARFEDAMAEAQVRVHTGGTSKSLSMAFMGDSWL